MKKLIVINGTMGVGKTAVSSMLNKKLKPSVWLDGDWCWHMNPWIIDEQNKKMVEDNISYLLNNFLKNDNYQYIIFNWVLHKESIWQSLNSKLIKKDYDLHRFTLICSEKKLRERMIKDNRAVAVVERSVQNYQRYLVQNTTKIDTTDLLINEVVDRIIGLL
ncbi:AAA family ATPase [Clostridium sp. 'deep sea']|uniref:AAA family ATPase n=1 Tax=Clostridium sp. 'deep sea' TaxID=2779445 RepID=UPI00189651BD|nr:AAA family ATPase [Clostridium sp. 'deep sea']QOR36751.1 AAA family ATPase [Clostridium sp. 'deep sea']